MTRRRARRYDSAVAIWDPATGAVVHLLQGHPSAIVASLAVFPDPETGAPRLVSGASNRTIRVWDPSAGGASIQDLVMHMSVKALAATPKGDAVIAGVGSGGIYMKV